MSLADLWDAIILFMPHLNLRLVVFLVIHSCSVKWRNWWYRNTITDRLIAYVKKTAKRGDPNSVLDAMERYNQEMEFTLIVDPEKREKLETIIRENAPMRCFEMGCYIGCSAIAVGKNLPAGGRLITTEPNQQLAKIAQEIIEFAGLDQVITVLTAKGEDVIEKLRSEYSMDKLDFVFIDHDPKSQYLPDLKRLERANVLREGALILADNVLFPGAPDYLGYVENCDHYETERYDNVVCGLLVPDIMTISTYSIDGHQLN